MSKILFSFFLSSLLVSNIPKNFKFSFSLSILALSWFGSPLPSIVSLFEFFVISMAHFSMPNSIPTSWLYILIVCFQFFFIFLKFCRQLYFVVLFTSHKLTDSPWFLEYYCSKSYLIMVVIIGLPIRIAYWPLVYSRCLSSLVFFDFISVQHIDYFFNKYVCRPIYTNNNEICASVVWTLYLIKRQNQSNT